MTMIEVMVVAGLMAVACAAAGALVLAAGRMVRNTEQVADGDDAARMAGEAIVGSIRNAAMGAPGGIYVKVGAATTLINPIMAMDGTTGAGGTVAPVGVIGDETDELWLVVPERDAMLDSLDLGGSTSVARKGTGALSVTDTAGLVGAKTLLVTNLTTAALISNPTFIAPSPGGMGTINYAESGPTFSNAPEKFGFQAGDIVYRAQLVHFFVQNNARGVPTLYRQYGRLAADAYGRPFSDPDPLVTPPTVIQEYIEDFQVAFGFDPTNSGNPDSYVWVNRGNPPGTTPWPTPAFAAGMRSIRISIISRSRLSWRENTGTTMVNADLVRQVVENHTPNVTVTQGFRRGLYTRRVELTNLLTGNL